VENDDNDEMNDVTSRHVTYLSLHTESNQKTWLRWWRYTTKL